MAWTLRLYRSITPNEGRNTHYVFSTALDYINELESARIGDILLDNFRINANRAEINATPTLEEMINEITYVIVYDADTNYFRAYWVTSSVNESGMIKLTLNVDLWASSIIGARFSDMHVTRCNRAIDNFMYFDPIKKCKAIASAQGNFFSRLGNESIDIDFFVVVMQLNFNVSSDVFGNNQITRNALYQVNAKTLLDALNTAATNNYTNINALERIADALGGVHEVAYGNKAQVTRAWIIPSSDVTNSGYSAETPYTIKSKCHYSDLAEASFSVLPVAPRIITYSCDITSILQNDGQTTQQARGFQATHALTLGALTSGYNLARGINSLAIYKLVYSADDVRVLVSDGINERDITKAFEFSVTGNNATETIFTRISNMLGRDLDYVNQVVGGYMSGGGAGAYMGMSKFASSYMRAFSDASPLNPISTGDASTNYFNPNTPNKLLPPYRVYYFESANDEIENALMNGANVDCFISSLPTSSTSFVVPTQWVFDGVTKVYSRAFAETFIMIDDMKLDGVQENAKDYIKNEFGRGIFYKSI